MCVYYMYSTVYTIIYIYEVYKWCKLLCMALECIGLLRTLRLYTIQLLLLYSFIYHTTLYLITGLLRTRLQASGMHGSVNYKSPTDGIVQIFQTEGFKGFFRVCIYYSYTINQYNAYIGVCVVYM